MKIIDIVNQKKCSLSFEVFPPKQESGFDSVRASANEIALLKPSFMSVTYGAGGGTSEYTLALAKSIKDSCGVESLAHLTCVSSTKDLISKRIEDFTKIGIKNIMALRGDIPPDFDMNSNNSKLRQQDYTHAVQLVKQLKESGDFCIGAACYPEVHPESATQNDDLQFLSEKVDAGVDFLVTQMFFDNNVFYNFMYKIREIGISIPVIPGIMPVTNSILMTRILKLSGSFLPRKFTAILDRFGNNPPAMSQAGIAYATEQIIDLFANGITNVHVYSMNKPEIATGIVHNLSNILGGRF